jgi:hypothetical protein
MGLQQIQPLAAADAQRQRDHHRADARVDAQADAARARRPAPAHRGGAMRRRDHLGGAGQVHGAILRQAAVVSQPRMALYSAPPCEFPTPRAFP